MFLSQATYKRIEQLCDSHNIRSINKLCNDAGVSQSTVYDLTPKLRRWLETSFNYQNLFFIIYPSLKPFTITIAYIVTYFKKNSKNVIFFMRKGGVIWI